VERPLRERKFHIIQKSIPGDVAAFHFRNCFAKDEGKSKSFDFFPLTLPTLARILVNVGRQPTGVLALAQVHRVSWRVSEAIGSHLVHMAAKHVCLPAR
jgi:hypothetical protein